MFKIIKKIQIILLLSISFLAFGKPNFQCESGENTSVLSVTSHIQDNTNGTLSDPKTGLVWKKCSEGQTWVSGTNTCSGSATVFNWKTGLQQAIDVNAGSAGENLSKTSWRVPNIKELASIVEQRCWDPSINSFIFPSTPSDAEYWTSSPYISEQKTAWHVGFDYGLDGRSYKNEDRYVRLVHDK